MSSILPNFFSVNGVIDTNQSVMENLNTVASAAGAWVTFDTITGKWAVVINRDETTTKTFTDSDIIGPISISGKGLSEFYSDVQFEYPHVDLNDEKDVVIVSVADADLYPGETTNILNYSLDIVNNPTQIQQLASIELKQNRLERIVRFSTDFSSLGLKAGDIIEINTNKYGSDVFERIPVGESTYELRRWRITEIEEEDAENGEIILSITAMEHQVETYSTADLTRAQRSTRTGITYEDSSTEIADNRDIGTTSSVAKSLLLPAAASLGLRLLNNLFNKKNIEEAVLPIGFQLTALSGQVSNAIIAPSGVGSNVFKTIKFTPKYSGRYVGQILFDQNSSGANGGVADIVQVAVSITDAFGLEVVFESSGGPGTWYWTDWFVTFAVNLNAGQEYTLQLLCRNDTAAGGNADISVGYNIFAAKE